MKLRSRRQFLQHVLLTGGAVAGGRWLTACGGGLPTGSLGDAAEPASALPSPEMCSGELAIPHGPLSAIGPLGPADADGVAVPEGFTVRAVARHGTPPVLGGSYPWHMFPDGGACYPTADGGWIYTSNSEVPGGAGGCGALVFGADGTITDSYPILSNTSSNCAGGKTPWGTWVSCEETDAGLCWETDPYGRLGAVSKPALGLFSHEAICVDGRHAVVYLTEDAGDGRFYRWVADASDVDADGRLALEAGRLQVMNIDGLADGGYSDDPAPMRQLRSIRWVDAVNPDQPQGAVRAALGETAPGTRFPGGEGLWFYELPDPLRSIPPGGSRPTRGLVFFTTKGDNRVYALDIENQLIELIFDNDQIAPGFSDVDNLTVSPAGDILVAEDLTETGRAIRIMVVVPNEPARVLVEVSHPGSEITGPAFSPDGSRLYFSSQRGPIAAGGQDALGFVPGGPGSGTGATYEVTIPLEFRA